jgi:glycosyltransferase involved in cell wall biosynthesis
VHEEERTPLRICLLAYRGNPYSGGQGIYIHYLSRELDRLGHEVHVISGPPYPEVVDGITVHKVESLDLYKMPRTPWRDVARVTSPLRLYEYLAVCVGTFPEPYTFSIRAYHRLRALMSEMKFDIVHDNQCLASGLLLMKRLGIPVVATIHHPIDIDREIELAQAHNWRHGLRLRRFYSFLGMQHRVSPQLDRTITVSERSAEDIRRFFKIGDDSLRVVLNGVDTDFFNSNGSTAKRPNSLIMVSSGNGRTKGLPFLLDALQEIRKETPATLTVVGNGSPEGEPARLVREHGLQEAVTFTGKIDRDELGELYATSEIAVVPSLYEGFGLPAAEAMSCRLPVISTRAGALPEVVGEDGSSGVLVPAGDAPAITSALRRLLGDAGLRKRMGEAGRRRVEENFSWRQAAERTVKVYEEVV